jgi:hypothetical protein
MYVQLGLEVTSKSCEDSQISTNFHEFWSRELYDREKETLILERYNLIALIE